ncbi:MAG TPA: hypothetical protein VN048_19255 [Verrucomicrobiae bacterium]|jgi:hypothetical protein|nr:hypothetical protein [Verrucomicrobiae bacterium]
MNTRPLFIATERFDPSDGARWADYLNFAKIPGLKEVVSLDTLLCRRLINDLIDEDWPHIVNEDFRLHYFLDLDYLIKRVEHVRRRNILGLYHNTETHIATPPGQGNFVFIGYDLIEEATQISALTNCGGFPNAFSNEELNACGLLPDFTQASTVRLLLAQRYPKEHHAQCELYAIWRLNETQ